MSVINSKIMNIPTGFPMDNYLLSDRLINVCPPIKLRDVMITQTAILFSFRECDRSPVQSPFALYLFIFTWDVAELFPCASRQQRVLK